MPCLTCEAVLRTSDVGCVLVNLTACHPPRRLSYLLSLATPTSDVLRDRPNYSARVRYVSLISCTRLSSIAQVGKRLSISHKVSCLESPLHWPT